MPLVSIGHPFGLVRDSLDGEVFEDYIKRKADESEKRKNNRCQWLVLITIDKFLECTLGELPQTVINIIYFGNNVNFIRDNSYFFGLSDSNSCDFTHYWCMLTFIWNYHRSSL